MNKFKSISEFAKVRRGASPRPITDPKYFGGNVGWIRISDVTSSKKYLKKTEQYLSPLGESLSVKVDKGDLIMSICGTIGRPIIIDVPACIHDGFVQLYNIKDADTNYLYYALQDSEKRLEAKGQPGTQVNLNTTIVGNHKIFFPSKKHQKKIAAILTTIDNLILATEAAIKKYNSIKRGMMCDLFSRGIHLQTGKVRAEQKTAPELYKESKIGWIPKEWSCSNVITTTYVKGRIGWEGLRADEFIPHGPYLITGTDFFDGKIDWSKCYHISETRFREAPSIHLRNEDILITKDGTIGKVAFVENCPEKAILNSGIFVMRCKNSSYRNKYFYYLLTSEIFESFLRNYQGGSTIVHLYQREFEKFNFPIPSLEEQDLIVERLSNIDKLIAAEEALLIKRNRQKQGLMQDLLTGKVEVKINEKELA